MKHILSTIAALAFVVTCFVQLSAQASIRDCNTCIVGTPDFVLYMDASVSPPANGSNGFGTTEAQFEIHLFNNTAIPVNLATIEYSMGINNTQLTSLVSMTSDAVEFSNSQQIVFFPDVSSVTIIDEQPEPLVKTIFGHTYNLHYGYDHTVTGSLFPTQTIAAGATEQIITIFLTLDGSQTFVDNDPSSPMYIGDPKFILGYPGDCVDNDNNINNQFGFEDDLGNQILNNCYKVISGAPSGGLPIELTEFTGEVHDQVNRLYWKTQVEINTRWHHIERSVDPTKVPFREIGKVPAAGNTETITKYEMDDDTPPAVAYYRLKTTDEDETIQYSDVIVLKRDSNFDLLSVYPNPTIGEFEVKYSVDAPSDIQIEIVDVLGRVLQTHQFSESEGIMKHEFDLSPFADGIYILRVTNGIETKTKEVVKSRP